MAQDGPQTPERMERIAQALAPHFEQARLKLAGQMAQAQEGRLIEQTEMLIFEELNRLKTTAQEVGLQERVRETEEAFSPSGPAAKDAQQGPRPDDAADGERAGGPAGAALAGCGRRKRASRGAGVGPGVG